VVEVPPTCPLRAEDVDWAFSGIALATDQTTGEICNGLIKSSEQKMLTHYKVGENNGACRWRTVTAAVLPSPAADSQRDSGEGRRGWKRGLARRDEISHAAGAVMQALRHANIHRSVVSVRAQREPFDAKGAMAQCFANGTRFAPRRLCHVEIEFAEPVSGPLVIGDGRYLGLGVMAPAAGADSLKRAYGFQILEGLKQGADPSACATALRRAVMARAQLEIGVRNALPTFFTGHETDGSPARTGKHAHLAFVADLLRQRVLIVAPHALEQRDPLRGEVGNLRILDRALQDLNDLRAGYAGRLRLSASGIDPAEDCLFGGSLRWESVTDYAPTRYAKRLQAREAMVADVLVEIHRLGLPAPMEVEVTDLREGPRGGLSGRLRLQFKTVVHGPILIGRTRHLGGGLFAAADR
jgi:CRISPR-associated protein Csb2